MQSGEVGKLVRLIRFLAAGLSLIVSTALLAAPAPQSTGAATTNSPAPSASTNDATAIAAPDIASQAEATMSTLENLTASLEIDRTSQTVQGELPALISLVEGKLDDTANDLASHPTLPRLHRLETEWSDFHDELN